MKFNEKQRQELREILFDGIIKSSEERIKLDLDSDTLRQLLFDQKKDDNNNVYYNLITPYVIFIKLDFNNVSFDSVYINSVNFAGSKGVKINPQTVYNKDMYTAKLADAEIIGSFDGVDIRGANFMGSKGAKINPQTVYNKNMFNAKLADAEIIGSFDGVDIRHVDFTGSKGAKVNPQTVYNKDMFNAKLADAEIIGSFDGVNTARVDFTGCAISDSIELDDYQAHKKRIKALFEKKM